MTLNSGNGTVVYLQPPRRSKIAFRPPTKPITVPVESRTIYKTSFIQPEVIPRKRKIHTRKYTTYGEFDSNTVHNLTYTWPEMSHVQQFRPRPRLGIPKIPMDTVSIHTSSYYNPGIVERQLNCKIVQNKSKVLVPMESTTTTILSYMTPPKIPQDDSQKKIQTVKDKWRSNFKPDYQTNYRENFQKYIINPNKYQRPHYQKATITSKINGNTIYNTSYRAPGQFSLIRK